MIKLWRTFVAALAATAVALVGTVVGAADSGKSGLSSPPQALRVTSMLTNERPILTESSGPAGGTLASRARRQSTDHIPRTSSGSKASGSAA